MKTDLPTKNIYEQVKHSKFVRHLKGCVYRGPVVSLHHASPPRGVTTPHIKVCCVLFNNRSVIVSIL